jgi:aspartate aminotransferase
MTKLSTLLDRFNEPETLKMAKLGRELRSMGFDVIDLSLGEPDFDTPEHIKQAAIQAIHDNYSHYTPVAGYPELRAAVCSKLKRDNGLDYAPEQIVVSTGAKQSLANIIFSLVDKDDEVIIPTPYWVTYSELVKMAGGKVVEIKTDSYQRFKITAADLKAAITPKTRLFLFSSPCNPSGAVYSLRELEELAEVFKLHPDISIISDEIYEYIRFGGEHVSIASITDIKDRVIIVNGLSKGFAMTGWRLGYMAASTIVAKSCEKIQGQFTSGANAITQRAAITALTTDLSPTHEMNLEFTRRKNRVMELVAEIPGLRCTEPEGAFYIFPDVSSYYGKSNGDLQVNNSADFSMYLLHTAHVSSVMGDAFGDPNCIRFSFANNLSKIETAWSRIKDALAKLA